MTLGSVLLSEASVIDLDGTFFLQLGIFLLTFVVLNVLVFRPLIRLFDARHAGMEGAREAARALTLDAAGKAEAYDEQLRKIRLAAGQERERLRAEGQRLEKTILAKVRDDTQAALREAESKLERQAASTRKELDANMPALANTIAQKILLRDVT